MGMDDRGILEWEAANEWTVLTHDRKSMVPCALERITNSRRMPNLFFLPRVRRPAEAACSILDEVTLRQHEGRGWNSEVVWPLMGQCPTT